MTKDEEKGYIERVLAGDESAYEPLVTENQTKVYRLALRILKNEADAEDAAQEAFLKAYTSLADFRGDSRFSVWLYRLTNNICIDMLRKSKRAVIVSLQTEDDDGEETEIAIPDERYSPERLAERAADRDAIEVTLYLGVASFADPDRCQHLFTGEMKAYDTITHMVLTNQINEAEKMYICMLNPMSNRTPAIGLVSGIGSTPFFAPIALKALISKEPLDETERLMNTIKLDKDDYHLLRYYNMMVINRPASLFLQ